MMVWGAWKKCSTNLEDYNFTQNQRPPPQEIENSDNNSGVADSGATPIHLLPTVPTRPIIFGTIGGYNLTNSHECNILVKSIPKEARTAHIFLCLQQHSLISIAPLCGTRCKFLFNNQEVIVTKNDQVVWKGWCYWRNKLWRLPLQKSTYFTTQNINRSQRQN